MPVYLTPPPRSPLARALAAIVGAVLLVAAFMIGMVAFVVLLGVGLITGIWLWFRTRHLRREIEAAANRRADPSRDPSSNPGDAIEGEYSVVSRDEAGTDGNDTRDR